MTEKERNPQENGQRGRLLVYDKNKKKLEGRTGVQKLLNLK